MINRFVGVGRITKDIEVKFTNSGVAVTQFTIAINRKYEKDETDFIPVVAWRGLAENCAKYVGRGSLVGVEGRLQVSTYEDKDGKTVWKTEVIADDVRFLDSKKQDSGDPFQGVGVPMSDDDLLPF